MTNGEFLEFVESGGYQNRDLWSEEGNYVFLLHISTTCMYMYVYNIISTLHTYEHMHYNTRCSALWASGRDGVIM